MVVLAGRCLDDRLVLLEDCELLLYPLLYPEEELSVVSTAEEEVIVDDSNGVFAVLFL